MLRKLFGSKHAAEETDAHPVDPPTSMLVANPVITPASFLRAELSTVEDWEWPSPDEIRMQLLANDCGELWRRIPNGHKWLNYFDSYEALFSHFRGKAPKILEIGVDRGGSLILWRKYFGDGCQIIGIDINADCAAFDDPANGIHVRIGSQDDSGFLGRIIDEFGPFDIIIDDGSHVVSHQIASFNALFDRGVRPGGIYMVEDLETSYWGSRSGQADLPVTFIDFARSVLDLMHQPYIDHDYMKFRIETTPGASLKVPRIAKLVDQIRFFDSIAAFYRANRLPPVVEYLFDVPNA